jgi:hypothetical protein
MVHARKWAIKEYVLSKDAYFQWGGKLLYAPKLFTIALDLCRRKASSSSSPSALQHKTDVRNWPSKAFTFSALAPCCAGIVLR